MKPLSALNFTRNNKKKFITAIIAVVAAVSFLYMLQTFIKSMYTSLYQLNVASYKTHMMVLSVDDKNPIPQDIITKIKEDENIERTVPFLMHNTRYTIPGSISDAAVYGLRSEDIDYVMKKHNIKLLEGRLPKEGTSEIALDIKIAKNKKVKLGDKIGNKVDKMDFLSGEYTVTGILDSEDFISIIPYNTNSGLKPVDETAMLGRAMLLFPKKDKLEGVDKLLSSFPKNEVTAITLSDVNKTFRENATVIQIFDLICVLAIIVMVVATVSSKYVQFFNRRQELGILNAIGYTKLQIMKKTLVEVTLVNLAGFVLGILLGILESLFLKASVFSSSGGIAVVLYYKAFLMALFVPLFATLFTLVPVNRMITRLDPINMIEGVI